MKQEKTVVMVSTEKTATVNQIVSRKSDNRLAIVNVLTVGDPDRYLHTTQHLYILSDEEVKHEDWYIVELFKITGESDGLHLEQCKKLEDVWVNNFDVVQTRHKDNCKKVIATTNPDLWYNENKLEGKMNLVKVTIPKLGLDFVERFVKEWEKGNKIEKVMLEYEIDDTLSDEHYTGMKLKIRSNGSVIISPIEEKKYSKYHINMAIREAIMYPEKFMTGIVHDDKKSLAWVEQELNKIYK